MKYEKFVIDWQKRLKKALQRVYNYEDLDNFIASVIEATKLKYNNLCPNCYDVLEPNASPLRVKIKFIYRGEEYPRRIKIEEDYEELEVIIPEMNDEYFLARIDSGGNYKLLETISSDKVEIKANPLDAQVSQPSEPSFGQWTLTKDRMPLHSGFYLTVDINENDEPFIMIYPYDEIDKTFVDMAQYPNKDVIKWMPLPKP